MALPGVRMGDHIGRRVMTSLAAVGIITTRPHATPRNQSHCVRCNYAKKVVVEGKGFEPSTSALRTPRSPN